MNLLSTIRQTKKIRLVDVSLACAVMLFLFGFYGTSVWQLFSNTTSEGSITNALLSVVNDSYIRHVVGFSFFQAFLSAILSISFGLLTAHALYYHDFLGKKLLLKLFSLSMVLPVLVAIFGVLGVYGKSGWLASLVGWLSTWSSIDWQPNIYGLSGILITHVFFNLPLSAKVFLNALQSIPNQQRKLSAQLGITNFNFFRLVEWAYIRQQLLPIFTLVFMLCFTSFTIVLTLGGSPKYTTLEVAIYQAVTFNFELKLAGLLALLQFGFCFVLFWISTYFSSDTKTMVNNSQPYKVPFAKPYRIAQGFILIFAVLFTALPLLNVMLKATDINAWVTSLQNPRLLVAAGFSLCIAICAGILSLFFTIMLLMGARQFYWVGLNKLANNVVNTGMMILSIPTLVLAVGLFLMLQKFSMATPILFSIIVVCNALMAMPFALRIMAQPMYNNMVYYERLCQSLGIRAINRFKYVEWHSIKQPLLSAWALATALSLGDFTAIALFGNQNFTSLPHLLYQQLGNYRSNEAAVTAFILLICSALIFILVERYSDEHSSNHSHD